MNLSATARRVATLAAACACFGFAQEADEIDHFERRVRPILANRCYACHGPHAGAGQAGLRLDSLAGMLRGGRSGPAIAPGSSERSLLIHAINHDTSLQMPPKAKLPISEVVTLTRWVDSGAFWPNARLPVRREPPERAEDSGFTDEERSHWAFQAVRDPRVPSGGATPIDSFVRRRLEERGLHPAQPCRQADLDPTRDSRFARAAADYRRSPGLSGRSVRERFRGGWSSVCWHRRATESDGDATGLTSRAYADSNGMDDNVVHGDAWRYRDYVIESFNRDKRTTDSCESSWLVTSSRAGTRVIGRRA